MNADEHRWNAVTERIIGCVFKVANTLGCGFLECVYKRAMLIELHDNGLEAEAEKAIEVVYRGQTVGHYLADIIVENNIILELKAVKELDEIHKAQCINYLKASHLSLCLLINFGSPKVSIKRIVRNF